MKGFNQDRSGRRESRGFGRGDVRGFGRKFGRPTMHEVTCDKCGERCEVPFKPTGDKPVYCRNCFRKDDNSKSKDRPKQFTKELEQINKKLDKILNALNVD